MAWRMLAGLLLLCAAQVSASVKFAVIGDYGANTPAEGQVAGMVHGWNPDFVITTGDNSYGSSDIDLNIGRYYASFIGAYTGIYGPGSATNRFFPSIGNHDYSDGGGISAYLSYFALPGDGIQTTQSSDNPRYYDFVIGPVHFFVVNSNIQESDGITSGSTQAIWLRDQLAISEIPWKVVYFHHPPFSSASHGSNPSMQWPFEAWGASLVLNGHDHTYERIQRDDNGDSVFFTYIVNGLGGRSIYTFPSSNLVPGSMLRYNATYGANWCVATDSTLMIKFVNIVGATIDSILMTRTTPCCIGSIGNVNGMDGVDLLDLSAMVGYLIDRTYHFPCTTEADLSISGRIDLSDISMLIAYLSGTLQALPDCPGSMPGATANVTSE